MILLLSSNAFLSAYYHSDLLGKIIFISLFTLSIVTWSLIIKKWSQLRQIRRGAHELSGQLSSHRHQPLHLELSPEEQSNPYLSIYAKVKERTLEILAKNQSSLLSSSDVELVEEQVDTVISRETKGLERHLYLLGMTVSLAPFLGLLGTVWGILITFPELQTQAGRASSGMVLNGLSMALATTVFGLIVAIPALIASHYLRSQVRDFSTEMFGFSSDLLGAVEMQYRKVDLNG
jgi:biopolymer transport protein TolQ